MSQLKVQWDFKGRQSHELSVSEGEVVTVLEKGEDGWFEVESCDGKRRGLVPENFLAPEDSVGACAADPSISLEDLASPLVLKSRRVKHPASNSRRQGRTNSTRGADSPLMTNDLEELADAEAWVEEETVFSPEGENKFWVSDVMNLEKQRDDLDFWILRAVGVEEAQVPGTLGELEDARFKRLQHAKLEKETKQRKKDMHSTPKNTTDVRQNLLLAASQMQTIKMRKQTLVE